MGTLTGFFFAPTPVTNYEEAQQADHARVRAVLPPLLDAGIFLAPSGYETLFVSLAHTDDDRRTVATAADASAQPQAKHVDAGCDERCYWRVVVLRQTVAAHVVHEEQRTADGDDHHDHEHEGEATGAVALLPGVDQLLSTRRHRQREQRADVTRAETDEGTDPSQHGHTFVSSESSPGGHRRGPGLGLRQLHLVLLPPVQREQTEAEEDRR